MFIAVLHFATLYKFFEYDGEHIIFDMNKEKISSWQIEKK